MAENATLICQDMFCYFIRALDMVIFFPVRNLPTFYNNWLGTIHLGEGEKRKHINASLAKNSMLFRGGGL